MNTVRPEWQKYCVCRRERERGGGERQTHTQRERERERERGWVPLLSLPVIFRTIRLLVGGKRKRERERENICEKLIQWRRPLMAAPAAGPPYVARDLCRERLGAAPLHSVSVLFHLVWHV